MSTLTATFHRRIAWPLTAFFLSCCAAAQDLVGETAGGSAPVTEPTAAVPRADFVNRFLESYTTWDVFKIGWLLATVVVAYGIGTVAFRVLLGSRKATLAGKYGCFWGALGFLVINVVVFGIVLYEAPPQWLGWVLAVAALVLLVLLLLSRKKVRA
ncbi:MAG: hypothetical protein ACAH95_08910 [Fimbriimonas sp.]